MSEQKLHYQKENGVGIITMDYQKNLNAIDEPMIDALSAQFDACEADEEVNVILIRSEGKAFSAGGDITYFNKQIEESGNVNLDSMIEKSGKLVDKMKRLSKLIIASVGGIASGAGACLAFASDMVIASENAKFVISFVNLGLTMDFGAVYLLSESIGIKRTLDLCITGRAFSAKEAMEYGLIDRVVGADALPEETRKMTEKFAEGPVLAYKNIKKQIYDANFREYASFLKESEVPTEIECAKSEDFKNAVKSFIAKEPTVFHGK